jgi:hypothetical protein
LGPRRCRNGNHASRLLDVLLRVVLVLELGMLELGLGLVHLVLLHRNGRRRLLSQPGGLLGGLCLRLLGGMVSGAVLQLPGGKVLLVEVEHLSDRRIDRVLRVLGRAHLRGNGLDVRLRGWRDDPRRAGRHHAGLDAAVDRRRLPWLIWREALGLLLSLSLLQHLLMVGCLHCGQGLRVHWLVALLAIGIRVGRSCVLRLRRVGATGRGDRLRSRDDGRTGSRLPGRPA